MKREILETIFPEAKGEYTDVEWDGNYMCYIKGEFIWRTCFYEGRFSATKFLDSAGENEERVESLPIKAIHLISQYENQPK